MAFAWPCVAASGPNQPIVFRLLDYMGSPAGDACSHEERRVQRHFQPQRVKEPARRPIEIRKEVFFISHGHFDDRGDLFP